MFHVKHTRPVILLRKLPAQPRAWALPDSNTRPGLRRLPELLPGYAWLGLELTAVPAPTSASPRSKARVSSRTQSPPGCGGIPTLPSGEPAAPAAPDTLRTLILSPPWLAHHAPDPRSSSPRSSVPAERSWLPAA